MLSYAVTTGPVPDAAVEGRPVVPGAGLELPPVPSGRVHIVHKSQVGGRSSVSSDISMTTARSGASVAAVTNDATVEGAGATSATCHRRRSPMGEWIC